MQYKISYFSDILQIFTLKNVLKILKYNKPKNIEIAIFGKFERLFTHLLSENLDILRS